MKLYQKEHTRIWYNEQLLSPPVEECCDPLYWQQNNKVIGSAQGRGTTWFIQLDNIQAALRHYRRGGLFGKLVFDRYFFVGWEKTRSYCEYQLLQYLAQQGVHVPQPIAAKVIKRGWCYQADLLSEKITNAHDLVSILQKYELASDMYIKIGKEIRKMHDTNVNHTDLNIHNILIDNEHKVWIIDFDKCYIDNGDRWKKENIQRLLRSFIKEKNKRNIKWDDSFYQYILSGYKNKIC